MDFKHYPETDSIFIRLRAGQSSETRELDEQRSIGLDENGNLVWVSLLYVSDGIDLDMLDGQEYEEASRLVAASNIKELV